MSFIKEINGVMYNLLTEEERYRYVKDYLEDNLNDNLSYFGEDFIEDVVDVDRLEEIHRNFATNYVNDIEWETNEYSNGRLQEEMKEWRVSNKDEFIEALVKNSMSEGAFGYLKSHFGDEEALIMVNRAGAINIDDVIDKAIEMNGYGHFLNSYDGTEEEFEIDGVIYYGYREE